jgi:hypothetical protein
MAVVIMECIVAAAVATILTKLMTKKYPWELAKNTDELMKNLTYPLVNVEKGVRVSIPNYVRDAFSFVHSPQGSVKSSLAGMWGRMADVWQNRDFYNTEVYNPDAPGAKQQAEKFFHLIPQPCVVSNTFQDMPTGEKILGMAGFMNAPGYISETPAEVLMDKIHGETTWRATPYEGIENKKARIQAKKALRSGADPPVALQNLDVSQAPRRDMVRTANETPLAHSFAKLPLSGSRGIREAVEIYQAMTDEQKAAHARHGGEFPNMRIILFQKLRHKALTGDSQEKAAARKAIESLRRR